MNQRADSSKRNLARFLAKSPIECGGGICVTHMVCPIPTFASRRSRHACKRCNQGITSKTSWLVCNLQARHHRRPARRGTSTSGLMHRSAPAATGQVASDLAALLSLCSLGLCLMLRRSPADSTAMEPVSSPDRKSARQPGDNWDLFLIMQAVMRPMSGISELQRRNASPPHACCCSKV